MRVAEVFATAIGDTAKFRGYDGSEAGSAEAQVQVTINTPDALTHLVRAPGGLGLARAYIGGDLTVDGPLYDALRALQVDGVKEASWAERVSLLKAVGMAATRRVRPPEEEVRLHGRRHSKARDAEAIAHHYDVSNRFYEWVLGPSMAYTCAVYPEIDSSLEEAQHSKFDLVARKLGLTAGMRLLDVGCGWGGMVIHAAKHYGVKGLGVTLSRQQAEYAQKAIADAGLADLAEVRFLDYRDVTDGEFDAISSIGLTEHIGKAQQPEYFRFLYGKLKPGGRLLNHCITRPDSHQKTMERNGFINRYIFPDGELVPPGYIVTTMHDAGFEVRHLDDFREHYAMTLRDWCANLETHWDEAVAEVGERTAKIWMLYMAGSRLGFERNQIELHQVLGVKLSDNGVSGMPLLPAFTR